MDRTDWAGLLAPVRDAITARTGPVLGTQTVVAGLNSAIALFVRTASGTVFIKGLHADYRGWSPMAVKR